MNQLSMMGSVQMVLICGPQIQSSARNKWENFLIMNPIVTRSLVKCLVLYYGILQKSLVAIIAQKMKFPIEDFFNKYDQIRRKLRIWSYLLKKSLMENFFFYALYIQLHFIFSRTCLYLYLLGYYIFRSSHRRCSLKKGYLRNFAKFTGKHMCQSLFFDKIAGLRPAALLKKTLWHRCFRVKFVNFLTTPFFIERLWTTASEYFIN